MIKRLLTLALLVYSAAAAFAQKPEFPKRGALIDGKTMLKVDALSLFALKSYSFSLERAIGRRLSIQASMASMPERGLPGSLVDRLKDRSDDIDFSAIRFSAKAYTLDLRVYLSRKGYGHGFYLQPYFRHERFEASGLALHMGSNTSVNHPYTLSMKTKSNSGGISFGAQWLIGPSRNILLDWTILGVHYGGYIRSTVNAEGTKAIALPAEAEDYRKDVEEALNDISLLRDVRVEVSKDYRRVSASAEHPYLFLRTGIALGIRF